VALTTEDAEEPMLSEGDAEHAASATSESDATASDFTGALLMHGDAKSKSRSPGVANRAVSRKPSAVPRVLLIDDDASLLDVLALAFEDARYDVARARDGKAGLAAHAAARADAIVSDVNMPHVDGFSLCRTLRAANDPVPIVLLTSRDSEIDEALGLELGADDYVAKPFSTRVLLARVAALLRRDSLRASRAEAASEMVRGALRLDADRLEARWAGTLLTLTVTEFRLLEALARRPGIVLSRGQLLDQLRGDGSVVEARIVDTYVRRLRRKLEAIDARFAAIETVVGAGYRWSADGEG
jgi:DNA-binding response OmpR family regulator